MKTLGMHLVDVLEAYGVDTVFGIPGVHTVELYRGLHGSGIRHVTPRHEQGAGFMADGYARVSGKPGVCLIITGPGLTNIATAVGQAYADSIPMLVISGVNAVGNMGSGAGHLHELPDQRQLMAQITAFSHTVLKPDELEPAIARAFAVFASARPRPVHIEIPLDLMDRYASQLPAVRPVVPTSRPSPAPDAIDAAAELARKAKRPVIVAGGGAIDAGAELRALAERLDAPVVMTVNARGLLPLGHPLGVSGSAGIAGSFELLGEADLVVAIGTEMGPTDFDLYGTGRPVLGGPLVRIDIDPSQLFRGYQPAVAIVSDATAGAAALAGAVPQRTAGDGARRASRAMGEAEKSLNPMMTAGLHLMDVVRDTLPEAILIGDSTQPAYAGCLAYAAPAPRSWFCSSTGFGTLGYALPAAVGASVAAPARPAVCIIGDGGLQFTLPELGSAREIDAPLIVLVWNNRGYGEIKSYMISRQIAPVGVDIHTPDFVAIARAYGWRAQNLDRPDRLADTLVEARASGQPTLVVVDETAYLDHVAGRGR